MYKELGKLGLSQASTESEDPEYDMEQYGGGWVTGTESLGEYREHHPREDDTAVSHRGNEFHA